VNPRHERFRRGRGILPWRPNKIRSFDTFPKFRS